MMFSSFQKDQQAKQQMQILDEAFNQTSIHLWSDMFICCPGHAGEEDGDYFLYFFYTFYELFMNFGRGILNISSI